MKFEALRDTLLKPVQAVVGVVERRQTMPILANVLLTVTDKTLSVTATDLEVELVAQADVDVKEKGEVTVPARKLLDICRALPEGAKVSLSLERDRVTVKSGRSRFLEGRAGQLVCDRRTRRCANMVVRERRSVRPVHADRCGWRPIDRLGASPAETAGLGDRLLRSHVGAIYVLGLYTGVAGAARPKKRRTP